MDLIKRVFRSTKVWLITWCNSRQQIKPITKNKDSKKPRASNPVVLLFLGALMFVLSVTTQAQTQTDPATRAAREYEKRIQEEQQRRQEKLQTERAIKDVFLQEEKTKQDLQTTLGDSCVKVSLIVVQGVTQFEMSQIDELSKKYLNTCMNLGEINKLITEISELYLSKGFITSRAFVQPQRLKKGTLDVLVMEGKIEKLQSPDKGLSERQLRWAFPVEEGKILNLRELEQGIEQLNRLQQNRAQLDIKPGSNTGDSLAEIKNDSSGSLHGGVSIDNSGSEATGKNILGISGSWDNPLNSNDSLYLSISNALGGEEQAKSRSYVAAYSIPYQYALFNFSASHFDYQQLVSGTNTNFLTSGSSDSESLGLNYTAYRGQFAKFAWETNFTRKESKNYLEDVFLATSSRKLYLIDVGSTYTYKLNGGILHSSLKWTRSLNILDAKTKIVAAENSYQFNRINWDTDFSKGFSLFKQEFIYQTSLHLLSAPEHIIASEGLALGGRYTIRGIEGNSISGNKGGYLRNEFSMNENLYGIQFSPFIGLDTGKTNAPEYNQASATLSGGFFGVRANWKSLSADITYSKALQVPEYLIAEKSAVYFNLRFSL